MNARTTSIRHFAGAVALALVASMPAHAGEVNLRWNDCWGDGGVQNRVFACDRNTGSELLVASFVPRADVTVTGDEFVVDLGTAGPALAEWWTFLAAGSCRLTSLGLVSDAPASAVACAEWDERQAAGLLVSFGPGFGGASSARIRGTHALPDGLSYPVLAGHEYHAFSLAINHQKTVGSGACGGCTLGACIAFKFIRLTSPDPNDTQTLFMGNQPGSTIDGMVTWQGGTGVISGPGGMNCPAATPVRNSAWGAVKSLYR